MFWSFGLDHEEFNKIIFRAPWAIGPQEGRKAAEQGDQLAQGPRHLQPGRKEEAAVHVQNTGQTTAAKIFVPAGTTENLLSQVI